MESNGDDLTGAAHGLKTPLEGMAATEWNPDAPVPAPLRLIG